MKASDWISVKDMLPRTGERVLVMRQIENEAFPDIATYIRRDNYHNGGNPIFYLDDGFDPDKLSYHDIVLNVIKELKEK